MEHEKLEEYLDQENERIQALPGYYSDGSLRLSALRLIREEFLSDFLQSYGFPLPDTYINFHNTIASKASFSWHIDAIATNSILAKSKCSIRNFREIIEDKLYTIDQESKYYNDHGDTYIKKAYQKGYFCINHFYDQPLVLNSFRLFVIDFFDIYDNKCQKV